MDLPLPKDRTVLEPFAEIDPAAIAGVLPAVPISIRSLTLCSPSPSQNLAYLGTRGGKILVLSLTPSVELLQSATVSNHPIDSILVLDEIGRVLAVSDGCLFLLDPLLLQPARRLGFIKDVNAVSKRMPRANGSSSDPFENGGVTPRTTETMKLGQRFLQRISGGVRTNGVKNKVLETQHDGDIGCYIAVAAGKRLAMMKLFIPQNGDVESDFGGFSVILKDIQGVEGVKTMAWIDDSIIIGDLDGYSMFSASSGQCSMIFSLPESSGPPKLRSLWRSKEVLLLVDNVGVVVNELGQPVGGSLVFPYMPESIAEISSYVIVVRDGRMDLYRRKTGVCVQCVTFTKCGVGPCIVVSDGEGNGEIVVVATPFKAICFRKVSVEEQIKDLLRKKNYKEAICFVKELESEGEMSKEMLSFVHAQVGFLLLFDLHFEDAVDHFLLSESMQPSEIFPFIMRDPNQWSGLVPRNRYWGLHPPPVPLEEVIDDGLMAVQRALFLKKAGVDTTADEDFLLNPPSRAELLESAIESLIRYLCVSREKELIPAVQEGVDTLLMYLFRALNRVNDMEQLATSQNSCVVEELENLLDDPGHFRTLAFLYASKGMFSKALAIWRVLARNYSTGLWKDPATSVDYDSLDISTDLILSQKSAAAEASKLLQESSDQDLVLEHIGWIADIDNELAVLVLTSESRDDQFSPEEVLAAIDKKKVDILQRYLQWLIEDQGSDDTQFHTLYALSLAKSALEAVETDCAYEIDNSAQPDGIKISDLESGNIRERLQIFLEASDLYDPEEVLDLIEGSQLWREKAILYRKMGQENLVLQILALKLEDSKSAEQYCAEIGRNDAYMQLLDIYLDPQDGKAPMFKAAVRLLHNHGECLDPLQVLEKLSPEMPLQLASETMLRMLRARVHHHLQGQILHNLSQAVSLDAQLARLEERSRHVQINEETLCDSCHARLGTKLFAMYPDDSVVCYKCYRRQGESTSTHGRDFKQHPIVKPGWLVSR